MSDSPADGNQQNLQVAALREINGLSYNLSPDLASTVSRTQTKQYFSQNNYSPGSTAVCILNTGSAFVHPRNTSLVFTINNLSMDGVTPAPVGFGSDSACSMIRRISLMSRSGDVLERIESVNMLARVRLAWEYNNDESFAHSAFLRAHNHDEAKSNAINAGSSKRVAIPMHVLCGLFSVDYLLPSMLCSGMRLELEFENAHDALISTSGTTVNDYSISDIYLSCDSYQLTDAVSREINTAASTSGLEVVYSTWHNTQSSRINTGVTNIESRKAVSRALQAFLVERPTTTQSNISSFQDSKIDTSTGITEFQARLGNIYLPNSSIKGAKPLNVHAELYSMSTLGFKALGSYRSGITTVHNTSVGDFRHSPVVCVDLERTAPMSLSGVPISNSRVLAFNITYKDTDSSKRIDMYLKHVSLARVFLSNVSVEI